MNQPPFVQSRVRELSLEIIGKADRGAITLDYPEKALADFAAEILRNTDSQ